MVLKLGTLGVDIDIETENLTNAEKKTKASTEKMSGYFRKLGAAALGVFSIQMAKQALFAADNIRVLEGRIARITKTSEGFDEAWNGINKSADAAGVSIGVAAASFERFLMATEGMGATIGQVSEFNDLILKTGRISGASAVELSNALTQLSQGFSGGIIRAEEWNSIMEQAPEILRVVARNIKGVDGDLGKLRKVMLDGKLTSDKFFNAFMDGAEDINTEFEKLPKSIEASLQTLSNEFVRMISNLDEMLGLTEKIAYSFGFWADVMDKNKGRMADLSEEMRETMKAIKYFQDEVSRQRNPIALKAAQDSLDKLTTKYQIAFEEHKKLQDLLTGSSGEGEPLKVIADEGEMGPDISSEQRIKRRKELEEQRKDAGEHLRELFKMNESAEDALYTLAAERGTELNKLREKGLIDAQQQADGMLQIEMNLQKELNVLKDEAAEKDRLRRQSDFDSMVAISTSMSAAFANMSSDSDSSLAKISSGLALAAKSIVATNEALALSDVWAGTESFYVKAAQTAAVIAQFAAIGSILAGGRVNGGGMTEGNMYAVGEGGKSELLTEGGKQYLIAGKNASITGNGALKEAGNNSSSNQMVIQQNINVTGTGDQELISKMAQASERGAKMAESNFNRQMMQKSGPMFKSMSQNYGTGRTKGRAS